MKRIFPAHRFALAVTLLCGFTSAPPAHAQAIAERAGSSDVNAAEIAGERMTAAQSVRETTTDIAVRQAVTPPTFEVRPEREHEVEREREANPDAPDVSSWPSSGVHTKAPSMNVPQSVGLSFDGATLDDTHAFPPDTMGAVGPTQYVTFVNGRVRTFTKAGVADGVINADSDVFFASVITPVSGSVVLSFTSDPNVRYDRFSARWFLSIIDVPCTNSTCSATAANRWLLAVSDGPTITASTVWTFFYVQTDASSFCDYPSLGIDVNALYFGCNMFTAAGSFGGTNGYVVQKSSVLGSGPIVTTKFANLATATGAGPFAPRGVDNFDPSATVGYFVGPDALNYSTIDFRRVSNPGSGAPTISANISITVPTTGATNPVEHAGNTGGNNGRLDSLDDRLFAAMIRNGHLWTAHNMRVGPTGTASTASTARKASRWYDFTMSNTVNPALNQSGTVYDNASTLAASLQYWIPSIAVSGQGHAVIGFSLAGTPQGATPAYTGRLASDTLGTMAGVPGTSVIQFGTTAAHYDPTNDTGGTSGRRWGDYSFTVVDPLDDMTIWTTQEYNNAASSTIDTGGSYAARVGKLLAPPPATPNCSATPITFASGTGNVTITATSTSGSGFYDPGADLPSPALPFNHIHASMTNGTVNSVTYTSPTSVTLNITATTAGSQDVTIFNPDGQSVTANGCISVTGSATYTIGGAVGGLTGSNTVGLKLTDTTSSTSQTIASQANGSFAFGTGLNSGDNWNVTVVTQPTGQTCTVTNGSGTSLSANVTNVTVTCTTNTYTIGGNVSGLTGSNTVGLKLTDTTSSATQTIASQANGSFTFGTALNFGDGWNVTVVTQPTGQTCTVTNGSGSSLSANVTNVTVTCTTNTYTIGGAVGGLTGSNTVGLKLTDTTSSATQTIASQANGSFTFGTALNFGDGWNVTVVTQPTGQTCSVTNGSGTNLSANVSNVTVTCTTNTYTLNYTAGANGTLTGTTSQTVNYGGNGSPVTAVPNANYHFVQWSDGSTANPRTDTNVTASVTVTANFAINVLVFTTQPGNLVQGGQLGTIAIAVQDGNGNTLPVSGTADFTIAACSGSVDLGNATITNGVATLNSTQSFYTIASGLTVQATSGALSATSNPFSVGINTDLVFTDGFDGCRL